MTEQLTLPVKVAKSVDPKPTQNEIVEALARRLMQQEQAAISEAEMAVTSQRTRILEIEQEEMKKALDAGQLAFSPNANVYHEHSMTWSTRRRERAWRDGALKSVSYKIEAAWTPPDRLVLAHKKKAELSIALDKLRDDAHKSLAEAKRTIRDKMGQPQPLLHRENRVAAILSNAAAVKGLDAMLASFNKNQIAEQPIAT